jgi:hypothetical protein
MMKRHDICQRIAAAAGKRTRVPESTDISTLSSTVGKPLQERGFPSNSQFVQDHRSKHGRFLRFVFVTGKILTNPLTVSSGVHNHRMGTCLSEIVDDVPRVIQVRAHPA